jgi:6-pyruvoyltetrahydropterin/6-carboxytetrahydropterin synthase
MHRAGLIHLRDHFFVSQHTLVPEFENLNPSAENIAVVIYHKLRVKIAAELDLKIRLYETERNFVEFPAY